MITEFLQPKISQTTFFLQEQEHTKWGLVPNSGKPVNSFSNPVQSYMHILYLHLSGI